MSLSVDVVFISSSLTRYFRFSFRFRFFRFFLRFNFLMISQIAYFLHDAGCQQLQPCLCHFLCVYACVWVSLDTHTQTYTEGTVTEITMIIMKFCSFVEGMQGVVFFPAHALKFRHMLGKQRGKRRQWDTGRGGYSGVEQRRLFILTCASRFLMARKCLCYTHAKQAAGRQRERERTQGRETGRDWQYVCVCVLVVCQKAAKLLT